MPGNQLHGAYLVPTAASEQSQRMWCGVWASCNTQSGEDSPSGDLELLQHAHNQIVRIILKNL